MKLKVFSVLFLLSAVLSYSASAYKILGLFPHHGKSHHDVFEPLLVHLAERGHEMTIVSHFAPSPLPDRWKQIQIQGFNLMYKNVIDLNLFEEKFWGFERFLHIRDVFTLNGRAKEMCNMLTNLPEIKAMVEKEEHYDIVLVEQFMSDCALGVAHLLKVPVIALQSHMMMPWTYDRLNQPANPSYIPCIFLDHGPHMNFIERLENTVFHVVYKYINEFLVLREEREILQRNLNRTIPPLTEISNEVTKGLLTNTHFTLNGVKPLVPGIVEVGGIHLKNTTNPLEPELEAFMKQSQHGVVIFSMGSMIKASTFPTHKRDAFLKTFAEMKENVIWKWEGEPISVLPKNVRIMKWLPQFDILHHPKTVAFISHGGLLGTTEAVHAGVPMLIVPVFGDQHANAAAAQEAGLGVRVPYRAITDQSIREAMKKVLSSEMRASAKSLSAAWRDRPSPLTVGADMVEYFVKHGGQRFRSAAADLQLHQVLLLDVILFIVGIISLIALITVKMLRTTFSMCSAKEVVTHKKEAKNSNNNNNNNKYKQQ